MLAGFIGGTIVAVPSWEVYSRISVVGKALRDCDVEKDVLFRGCPGVVDVYHKAI
ncbi:hypothetical protein P0O24_10025 [Methanotrichaceae archaeon M04Ac]|uniref:Uncharacterized protein n=1 Tax=Candidatus Methanocrinis alkalitolerans TaxID=3033395 RepID=A0ABT5XGR9_9EURY|nr:hypothetical protein [Candidatus Methanocrinis alkalitolerans]